MEPVATGLTYEDLAELPDDGLRHELIDGEHFVTPAPVRRHQLVATHLTALLWRWADTHGGQAYAAPTDVVFTGGTVLEPDAVVLSAASVARLVDPRYIDVVPDLVVEVSSPTTRSYDLVRKRRVYEQHGVAEFWFVDLDAARIEVYVLGDDGRYGDPTMAEAGTVLAARHLDGLTIDVATLLA